MTRFVSKKEPVARSRGFKFVICQYVEGQMETSIELILPLLREATQTNYETSLEIPAGDQLLDEQAGHDCFSSAWVVSEQEA
jgi:hypothetical protein